MFFWKNLARKNCPAKQSRSRELESDGIIAAVQTQTVESIQLDTIRETKSHPNRAGHFKEAWRLMGCANLETFAKGESSPLCDAAPHGMGNSRCLIQIPGKPGREAVLLYLVEQSSITDVEILCRATTVPVRYLQRIQNQLRLCAVLDVPHDRSHA